MLLFLKSFLHVGLLNMNDFKTFIWPIDGALTVTTTLGQSGPGSNGSNPHSPYLQNWSFTTRCSLVSYSPPPLFKGVQSAYSKPHWQFSQVISCFDFYQPQLVYFSSTKFYNPILTCLIIHNAFINCTLFKYIWGVTFLPFLK